MNETDERYLDPIIEIQRIVNNFSNLNKWNFVERYCSEKDRKLIYDSEWCRMNIIWGGWDPLGGNSISIYYGRHHALNETATMVWEGETCHTWHDFMSALYFLDGTLPAEAAKMKSSHQLIEKYYEEEFRKIYHRRQPEWLMKMHMDIWDFYGIRFFELFDLRRPEIWIQYSAFLKEYYDIKGRRKSIVPSLDKVC